MKKRFVAIFAVLIFLVISSLGQSEKSQTYSLLLDNSGSLRTQLETVIDAGKAISQEINKNDSISVYCFEESSQWEGVAPIKLLVDWDQNTKLNEAINNLYIVAGLTTLYDAIYQMAEKLESKTTSNSEKNNSEKILILVTDGEDRKSKIKSKALIAYLKEKNIKVYAVGLLEAFDENWDYRFPSRNSKGKSKNFLEKITRENGGLAVFPKSKELIKESIEKIFAHIEKKVV